MQLGSRRLSTQLSFSEIAERGKILQLLFDKYREDKDGLSSAQLVVLAKASGILNKALTEAAVVNIFSSVKLSTKSEIDFERLEVRWQLSPRI
jgi:hypothetical protein